MNLPTQESSLTPRVRRLNGDAALQTPLQRIRDVLAPSPSPISKSAKKRGAAAHGHQRANSSHRSSLTPNKILWASNMPWLQGIATANDAQRKLEAISKNDIILAGAKVVYFRINDFTSVDLHTVASPLISIQEDSLKWGKLCSDFNRRKSRWQNAIISYVEATVFKCMTAWANLPANRDRAFTSLSQSERYDIWEEEWDRDPRGIAQEMWKPVGGSIDWGAIFDTPTAISAVDKAKIDSINIMLFVKWLFACEQVCQFVAVGAATPLPGYGGDAAVDEEVSAKQHLRNWRGFALHSEFEYIIVGFDAIPVIAMKANGRLEVATANGIHGDLQPKVDYIRRPQDATDS